MLAQVHTEVHTTHLHFYPSPVPFRVGGVGDGGGDPGSEGPPGSLRGKPQAALAFSLARKRLWTRIVSATGLSS